MKKSVHQYKIIKIVELSVFFLIETILLIILITNKTMRTSIFVDKSLFILCMIIYFSILLTYAVLIYDFIKIRELKVESHNLENLAFLDRKTGIPNRTSVNLLFDNYKTGDSMKGLACVLSEITNIKEINEANGKLIGDKAISDFTGIYEKSAEGYGFVGRNGGNEYITVIEKCNNERVSAFLDRLNENISTYNDGNDKFKLNIHSEYVLFDSSQVTSFSELVAQAYKKLGR